MLSASPMLRLMIAAVLCMSAAAGAQNPTELSTRTENLPGQSLSTLEAQLRQELDHHPQSAAVLYRLGGVLLRENKPKESLEIYTRAAQFVKPDAAQLRLVAMDYALLKLYNDAIHWLEMAHRMDPSNVDVLYDLGRCFYTQSRFTEAEQMYLKVLALKPDNIKAEDNLGLTLEKELRIQEAEGALRRAADWAGQQKSDEWPFLNLGTFMLDQGRVDEALPLLKRAASLAPGNAVAHEKLGRALLHVGDTQSGLSELERATSLDAANPRLHFELGRAYHDAGQTDKAAAEFARSKSLYGSHSED